MDANEIIQGTIALQNFAANAKYVEMIVDIAFAVVPSILGFGAAGLIGSTAIRTANDVMNSISVLQNLGPGLRYGMDFGIMTGKVLNKSRILAGEKFPFLTRWRATSWFFKPPKKKGGGDQDTQGKQEEQSSGGSGGTPPTPPDIKSDKKEEKEEIKNVPIHPSYDFPNPFKKKE
jgi:hypothetical protein